MKNMYSSNRAFTRPSIPFPSTANASHYMYISCRSTYGYPWRTFSWNVPMCMWSPASCTDSSLAARPITFLNKLSLTQRLVTLAIPVLGEEFKDGDGCMYDLKAYGNMPHPVVHYQEAYNSGSHVRLECHRWTRIARRQQARCIIKTENIIFFLKSGR